MTFSALLRFGPKVYRFGAKEQQMCDLKKKPRRISGGTFLKMKLGIW